LGILICEYEDGNPLSPDIYGIDFLKPLMDEYGFKEKDLVPAVFDTEAITSNVLEGKAP
jgi:HTH-type transcriptional regulator/antitoxin HigA